MFQNDIMIDFATQDGTAKAGEDYVAQQGTVTLIKGSNPDVIAIPILMDNIVEGDETFNLVLSNPTNGVVLARVRATVTIIDDDKQPDFALKFDPTQLTVTRGEKGRFNLNIDRQGGFNGNVSITAPDTKQIKIVLKPTSQTTTGNGVGFDFNVKKKAKTGVQQLTFTGTDESGRTRMAVLNLIIQ